MIMDRIELQRLRDLPIEGVAERLGLEVGRHKALCPFHDDHHASLSFSPSRNTFRCFACGAHGGTIDLAMQMLHKDFREACEWLSGGSLISEKPKVKSETVETPPTFDASRYERFFDHPYLSAAAKAFLFDERRIDPRVVRWCRLTSWRDRNGVDWLQIPYYDREGKLVGVQNRNLGNQNENQNVAQSESRTSLLAMPSQSNVSEANDNENLSPFTSHLSPSAAPRFRFLKGSQCGIYNLPVLNRLKEGEPLYITEGPSDCWAMLSAGHKAVAIPSATLLSKKDVEHLLSLSLTLSLTFHIYPDRDLPGERLFLQLRELLPGLQRHQLPPDCKDFSDYYLLTKTQTKNG